MKEIYFSNSNEDYKDEIYFSISELLFLAWGRLSGVVGLEVTRARGTGSGQEERERKEIKEFINFRYCIHRSGTYNIHVEYCTCRKKDGCNGQTGLAASWTLISFLLVVLSVRSTNLVR